MGPFFFSWNFKLDAERVELEVGPEESSPSEEAFGQATKPDIDKMHAYRDAIRDESGSRVVRSAAILFSGPSPQ